jgi:hypothetical protein
MLQSATMANDMNALAIVHNYYERLVFEVMAEKELDISEDTYADIACIALNQLPTVYIRNELDMMAAHTPRDLITFRLEVHDAVSDAIEFILHKDRRRKPRQY